MYFFIIGEDRDDDGGARRAALRPRHIDYWHGMGGRVKLGGPLLVAAEPDARSRASTLLIEAADLAEAQALADGDPFAREGVFASLTVSPIRLTLGEWLPD